jgi:A118 family predicted phage portal protein
VPLPQRNPEWPPVALGAITPQLNAWDAWYTGDPNALEVAYGAATGDEGTATKVVHPNQLAGGVMGRLARFFWGTPSATAGQPRHKLHVPIATDLCQASADLLWSEAPDIKVGKVEKDAAGKPQRNATQERLDELIDDQALQVFAEGAEVGAALGGHYLRVTWDQSIVPDRPFLTTVHADAAFPEFRWGRLVAVTFWHIVHSTSSETWRHLERHELDPRGNGIILHGLYRGTGDRLGIAVPLTEQTSTAGLADKVDAEGAISTESPGLAVVYVPNQRPQRRWRNDPVGANLGRSDLDGVEGLMDALDEVYSSWMRDIRLAKARLIVSESALEDLGPGKGEGFDLDREVFTGVNAPPTSLQGAAGGAFAQAEQFQIRHEEHRTTAQDLIENILRTAGYSPATFGIGGDGVAATATEVQARQQRSFQTRDRKLRNVRPAIAEILHKLLAVDAAVFRTKITPERPDVEFPDGVQESLLSIAQTMQALRTAEAASTDTLVRMLHPEWDDQQVTDEVARIMGEQPAPLPDPTNPNLGAGTDVAPAQPVG